MCVNFLLEVFKSEQENTAIIWKNRPYSYKELLDSIDDIQENFINGKIKSAEVVALVGDFSPNSIALLLALMNNNNLIVPLMSSMREEEKNKKLKIGEVESVINISSLTDEYDYTPLNTVANHAYYQELRAKETCGLILFSSGTSGEPKAAVHDFSKLMDKFKVRKRCLRTINFLLFDHWGGLNTLFYTISNGGVVLTTKDRKPEPVAQFIEKHQIELLPTSPTFLNLLILNESYKRYDLSSLKIISYGTEPMPQSTLSKGKDIFPDVKFQQTYGLIELGVLRSKSKNNDSLWVKLGGEGFDLRVVEGMLEIKSHSAMLGYLNAPSPFTDDGYFKTGDAVLKKGEYYRILGRKSEIINVGGEKVYPQEVENTILEMNNVLDVLVYGQKNPLTGNIVCAKVVLKESVDRKVFTKTLKKFCKERMQKFKIPVKVFIEENSLHGERMKKRRPKTLS